MGSVSWWDLGRIFQTWQSFLVVQLDEKMAQVRSWRFQLTWGPHDLTFLHNPGRNKTWHPQKRWVWSERPIVVSPQCWRSNLTCTSWKLDGGCLPICCFFSLVATEKTPGSDFVDASRSGSFGLPVEQEGLVSFQLENPYPPLWYTKSASWKRGGDQTTRSGGNNLMVLYTWEQVHLFGFAIWWAWGLGKIDRLMIDFTPSSF